MSEEDKQMGRDLVNWIGLLILVVVCGAALWDRNAASAAASGIGSVMALANILLR